MLALRRGRGTQGRRLRRHQAPARAVRRRPGLRHPARRDDDPRAGARRGTRRAAAGARRSSTWRTCTTPRTSCAARRPRCRSSPPAPTATRWSYGVAGLAYQQSFGGHFHNDNSVAVLRDVPGLVLAVPARPADAAPMLRSCLASAAVGRQRLRLPRADRALPHPRPATEPGDNEWLAAVRRPGRVGRRPRADRPRPDLSGRRRRAT